MSEKPVDALLQVLDDEYTGIEKILSNLQQQLRDMQSRRVSHHEATELDSDKTLARQRSDACTYLQTELRFCLKPPKRKGFTSKMRKNFSALRGDKKAAALEWLNSRLSVASSSSQRTPKAGYLLQTGEAGNTLAQLFVGGSGAVKGHDFLDLVFQNLRQTDMYNDPTGEIPKEAFLQGLANLCHSDGGGGQFSAQDRISHELQCIAQSKPSDSLSYTKEMVETATLLGKRIDDAYLGHNKHSLAVAGAPSDIAQHRSISANLPDDGLDSDSDDEVDSDDDAYQRRLGDIKSTHGVEHAYLLNFYARQQLENILHPLAAKFFETVVWHAAMCDHTSHTGYVDAVRICFLFYDCRRV